MGYQHKDYIYRKKKYIFCLSISAIEYIAQTCNGYLKYAMKDSLLECVFH